MHVWKSNSIWTHELAGSLMDDDSAIGHRTSRLPCWPWQLMATTSRRNLFQTRPFWDELQAMHPNTLSLTTVTGRWTWTKFMTEFRFYVVKFMMLTWTRWCGDENPYQQRKIRLFRDDRWRTAQPKSIKVVGWIDATRNQKVRFLPKVARMTVDLSSSLSKTHFILQPIFTPN